MTQAARLHNKNTIQDSKQKSSAVRGTLREFFDNGMYQTKLRSYLTGLEMKV